MLVGDCAGFLNMPKIKGTHTAMKSGMLAAEAIVEQFYGGARNGEENSSPPEYGKECTEYPTKFKKSWLYDELHAVRNCRQSFSKGLMFGMAYTGVATTLGGREPWTWNHHKPDHECMLPLSDPSVKEIKYPKPDGTLTFSLLENHARSGTNHNADQPCHLKVDRDLAKNRSFKVYGGPEGKYCPAGVYEYNQDGALTVNFQNCLHCKMCDLMSDPKMLNWTTPEGSGGPSYAGNM